MEPGDSSVSLSLDDLASFAPSLEGHSLPGGHDQSFDDGAASFLSGTDMSHDAFDLVGDSTSDGYSRNTPSIAGRFIQILTYFKNIFLRFDVIPKCSLNTIIIRPFLAPFFFFILLN